MFIVDFDDTLFSTTLAFRAARLKSLEALGVSPELYAETYQAARSTGDGLAQYNNRRHAQMLATKGFSEEAVYEALAATTIDAQLKNFLFPDAISFLTALRSHGQPMILLSLGDEEFQYLKVKGSGVADFFDRHFFVNEAKETILAELFANRPEKNAWFINDKVTETKAAVKNFKDLRVVLKQSAVIAEAEYKASVYPYFKTLTEIAQYVRTQSAT